MRRGHGRRPKEYWGHLLLAELLSVKRFLQIQAGCMAISLGYWYLPLYFPLGQWAAVQHPLTLWSGNSLKWCGLRMSG